jgi:hypothetical protein|tara:strand:+ start:248 stop:487 length:240 start_codon:yes stop_codon:yes gene_type:complete
MKEQQEPNFELINYFLQNATLRDKAQLITLMSPDLFVPTPKVHEDGTKYMDCLELDPETPCCPNGLSIQLHTTDFAKHK